MGAVLCCDVIMEEVVVAQRLRTDQLLPSSHGPSPTASPESSAPPSFHLALPSLPGPADTSSTGRSSGKELLLWHLERRAGPVCSPTSSSDEEHSLSEADTDSLSDSKPNASSQHRRRTFKPNPTPHSKEEQRKLYGSPPRDHEELQRTARGQRACWDRGGGVWRTDSLESMGSGCSPSITERVKMNRDVVKEMLNRSPSSSTPPRRDTVDPWRTTGSIPSSDTDTGLSTQGSKQRVFVSAEEFPLSVCHEKARRLLDRARMKARCFPLKADHNLLHLHREPAEVVSNRGPGPLQQTTVRRRESNTSPSEHLSDSSSGDSTCAPPRRQPGPSPTRVRFEDETEKEAEFRYLERLRQRRRAGGERAQGPLVSKPSLSALVNARRGVESPGRANGVLLEAGFFPHCGRSQEIESSTAAAEEASSRSLIDVFLHSHPPHPPIFPVLPESEEQGAVPYWVAPGMPCITLHTERIKETYIGGVIPDNALPMTVERGGTRGGVKSEYGCVSTMQVRTTNQGEQTSVNGHPKRLPPDFVQITPTMELPPNPYAQEQHTKPTQTQTQNVICSMGEAFNQSVSVPFNNSCPPPSTSLTTQSRGRLGGENRGAVAKKEFCALGGSKQTSASVKARGHTSSVINPSTIHPPPPFGSSAPPPTAAATDKSGVGTDCAPPTYNYADDGQVKGPLTVELHTNSNPSPDHRTETDADRQEGNPRLSLRQIFSVVGRGGAGKVLGRVRSNSLDQLTGPACRAPGPSPRKSSSPGQLRKTPSLQMLNMGSPFLKLKKSSSVQSDRSAAYSPGLRGLQRALSVEDVGGPSAVRSVGRVVQACADGTFLLDLHKPPSGSYGFLISRGKGRPDSGVYVEEMIDSSTEKLYAGLLAVGDEILEVNGEKVVGLSLDLVTHRLTDNNSANIRVLRHRKLPQR
ncbi:uncharacterized protein KIAA1614 isoform X2 [Lampris incognitus]|uniref:uncharacterized protein KIAA1614 isoform X2 n=1 Tax=Lampris incognitus TaxID=2546036 RepID=UPI0024B55014|nr:uncharacterized protein KIAA1614 isoform X2 [Lampris incognitus]